MNAKRAIQTGSILMAIAVICGAFGAHALQDLLAKHESADTFQTGVRYLAWHALGLLLLGSLTLNPKRCELGRTTGWLFTLGSILFAGSLLLLATQPSMKWLGPITPIGGALLIGGWLGFARLASKLD